MPTRTAPKLVDLAYFLIELLGGETDARRWLRGLPDGVWVKEALPAFLSDDNRALLERRLDEASIAAGGQVDSYRVAELDRVLELVPLIRAAEVRGQPAPRPSLVCTLPPEVALFLPNARRNFGRSLGNLVLDALRSATDGPVLIASPYWSAPGCERLRPALQRALDRRLPVTLAGARREDQGHHEAMVAFGERLGADGLDVRVLRFIPPKSTSLFHAKMVCGETGYLGSGNITAAGLESHVEVGMPLTPLDVAQAWWILDELERVEFLAVEEL